MGMYNRLVRLEGVDTVPAGWTSRTPPTDACRDWYRWHIAVKPFTDILSLVNESIVPGFADVTACFDLSATEETQMTECWTNFISIARQGQAANSVEARRVGIVLAQLLGAIERGQPQQRGADMSTNAWLYGQLGITTTTDDR